MFMKKLFISLLIGITICMYGCSKPKQDNQNTLPSTSSESPSQDKSLSNTTQHSTQNKSEEVKQSTEIQQKEYTLEELKKYDGKNGNLAYVVVDGKVYDVTNNKKWKKGMHEGVSAGQDISKVIQSSPHGKDILKEVQMVGSLK